MASENSPSKSNPNILHQFIISNSIPYQNQDLHAYGTDSISNIPLSIQCLGERVSRSVDLIPATSISDESNISHDRHLMDLLGTSNEAAHQAQRLSLSLGSVSCRERPFNSNLINPHSLISHEETSREACNMGPYCVMNDYSFAGSTFASQSQYCSTSYGSEPFATAIGSSKYLKPAQSLLEEIVSVGGNDIDRSNKKYVEKLSCTSRKGSFRLCSELRTQFSNNELLSEKHGTYVNLLKLLAMIEEVEKRYEQYHHHMEELVSSFETVTGLEAGKSYTVLALQAMSKHFYSLRNSILAQIRVTKQMIVKDRPKISSRLSQLSLLNQEGRHNRISHQQNGIMQSSGQAWRPIRGLPDTSVMILRAWLFKHFLNPYALSLHSIISNFVNPKLFLGATTIVFVTKALSFGSVTGQNVARKHSSTLLMSHLFQSSYPNDSEKLMLASQTGLSKNQVCNWFINARVRLWKPMIEEMYKVEFAESSTESDHL